MLHRSDRRDRHTATKISEQSHTFWYVLRLVRIKIPGPLRFELTRFHCISQTIFGPNVDTKPKISPKIIIVFLRVFFFFLYTQST